MIRRPFHFPSRLYPIVDPLDHPRRTHLDLAEAILTAGAPLLQLRAKRMATGALVELARALRGLTSAHGAALIINDRADVAQLVDADGVHLGQEDPPAAAARALLGADKIIGLSTHDPTQVDAAMRDPAVDYLGFGPIFPTNSKLDPDPVQGLQGLHTVRRRTARPIVAIGGITMASAAAVLAAGADAIAMIGTFTNADDVAGITRHLLAVTDTKA